MPTTHDSNLQMPTTVIVIQKTPKTHDNNLKCLQS